MPSFSQPTLCILVALWLAPGAIRTAHSQGLPPPSPSAPLFQERPFGPIPEPTPPPAGRRIELEERKSIPVGWLIAGGVAAFVATVALLYLAARAWRSSNLFDRQYRFPVRKDVAVRFGGTKSGGHMAAVRYGAAEPLRGEGHSSKTEDS